jgi:hypothetical protein
MAVFPWQSTVQDQDGNAIASAQLTIRDGGPSGAVSTIFSDSAETPLANPFNATSDGFAQFWAASGTYYIEAESGGQTTDGWYVVLSGAAAGIPIELTATVAAGEAVSMDGALVSEATAAEYLGLAQAAGVATDTINAQSTGNFTLGTWAWTPDEYVYLTNAGALTQTPPTGTHRRIGIATTSTVIALSAGPVVVETGGAGSENAIPALDDAGLLDYTMIEKSATGGAGAENLLVQADAGGVIDATFLTAVIDTSKQMTASGALTAGDAVALSAADTVEAVQLVAGTFGTTNEGDVGTEFGFTYPTNAYYRNAVAYDPTRDQWAFTYTNNVNTRFVVLFSYSAGVFTIGTAVSLGATGNGAAIAYHPVADVFVIAYGTNSLAAFSCAGLVITLGTPVTGLTVPSNPPCAIACSTVDPVFVAVAAPSNLATAIAGTISGTTITLGSSSAASAQSTSAASVVYHAPEDKFVFTYSNLITDDIDAKVITLTGTTIAYGGEYSIYTGDNAGGHTQTAISTAGTMLTIYQTVTNTTEFVASTVSGTVITTGTPASNTSGATAAYGQRIDYAPLSDNFVFAYETTGGSFAYAGTASVSGTTITVDNDAVTTVASRTGFGSLRSIVSMGASEAFFLSTSADASMAMGFIDPATPTINAAEFIGFAQATVADTDTVEVAMLGDVNTSQTGLTFNTNYYIAKDGTLSASDTGYGIVGRALSATEILVTKNTWSA